MNEITNIENSLEASTAKDNLLDIIGGSADYSIEKLLDMGNGVPIISYLTKGIKAGIAIRDFLFMEKVIEFLREVGKEPTASRQKMIDKIQEDSDYSQKFGKVSLIALERFDDTYKAKLLGQATRYLSKDEITFALYKRFIFIINRMHVDDIIVFAKDMPTRARHLQVELEALGLYKSQTTAPDTEYYKRNGLSQKKLPMVTRRHITPIGEVIKCMIRNEQIKDLSPDEQIWGDFNEY